MMVVLEMSSMRSAAPRAGTSCAFAAFPGSRLFVAMQPPSEKVFSMWESALFVCWHSCESLDLSRERYPIPARAL